MIWPSSETLKFIEPYLSPQLVSPKTFSHVQTMATLLPDSLSAHYFEMRLAPNTAQTDFSTCVIAAEGGREIFMDDNTTAALQATLLEHPVWQRVWTFFKCWADQNFFLHEQVPLVWLEFDHVNEMLPKNPLPCVNICLDPDYLSRQASARYSNHPRTQNYQSSILSVLEGLLGDPIPYQTRQNLINCFNLLPHGGQIIYISAMLARQPAALKLNGFVPKDLFLQYLAQIGWAGSRADIEELLKTFCTFIEKIRFDLTVGPAISSRVGFEFFSKGYSASDYERQTLLNQFVEAGLCTSEKRDALLAWPGFSSEIFKDQSWPTCLNRTWYTKIIYQSGYPLEAKGYLGFRPTFFSLF